MRSPVCFILSGALLTLLGCGKLATPEAMVEPTAVASADTGAKGGQGQDSTVSADDELKPDPDYPVPELAPDELLRFIEQLAIQPPRGNTEEEVTSDHISRARSRLIAADRLLGSPQLDVALTEAAVKAKLDALRVLAMLEPHGLGKNFQTFVQALKQGDAPKLALLGRVSDYEYEIDQLSLGGSRNADQVMARLKDILKDKEAGHAEFLITQYAGVVLEQSGYSRQASEALNLVGSHFAKSSDEELAQEAKDLLEKAAFREKVIQALNEGEQEVRALLLAIQDLLKQQDKLTVETLDSCLNAGQMLEYSRKFEDAKAVFAAVKTAYDQADPKLADPKLAEQASRSVRNAEKRLGVIGHAINIQGVHMDGTPFDWGKLKGKVVLVDFWATWSAPWRNELTNVKSVYDQFHEDGFEVVGVNLDEAREDAYGFLRQRPLPWPTVIDETVAGLFGDPNAVRYGVEALPFVMLVGRDGKVADIHVRGAELSRLVKQLVRRPNGQNDQRQIPN